MLRVILWACIITVVFAGHLVKNRNDPCVQFIDRKGIMCARSNYTKTSSFGTGQPAAEIKECYPPKGKFIHFHTCVAFKNGYLFSNGSIDRKFLTNIMTKDFESNPQLAENINNNCVNADLSKFYEKKIPELLKIKFCVELQVLKSIEVWDDEGTCHGIKEIMEECTKELK